MNRADLSIGVIASQQNPTTGRAGHSVEQRRKQSATSAVKPPPGAIDTVEPRRPASPVRLTLASCLGNKIDGAWWPRTGLITRELTELVSLLDVRLGQVIDINVNWSSLQRQLELNLDWWHGIQPHVMTVRGRDAQTKILIVPHRTGTALAVMVLRRAAGLPVYAAHRDSRAFQAAECIVRLACGEQMFDARGLRRRAEVAVMSHGPKD